MDGIGWVKTWWAGWLLNSLLVLRRPNLTNPKLRDWAGLLEMDRQDYWTL